MTERTNRGRGGGGGAMGYRCALGFLGGRHGNILRLERL